MSYRPISEFNLDDFDGHVGTVEWIKQPTLQIYTCSMDVLGNIEPDDMLKDGYTHFRSQSVSVPPTITNQPFPYLHELTTNVNCKMELNSVVKKDHWHEILYALKHSTPGRYGTTLEQLVELRLIHQNQVKVTIHMDECEATSVEEALNKLETWLLRMAIALQFRVRDKTIPL